MGTTGDYSVDAHGKKGKKMATGIATKLEKHERVLEKLDAVLKAIDDSKQETFEEKVKARINKEYVEEIQKDVVKNKRSLCESEIKGLNNIWKEYKDKPKPNKKSSIEDMKDRVRKLAGLPGRKGSNLLAEAISDAKEARELALAQAKTALEETFSPQMGKPTPPPPPPKPQGSSPKIKESELRRIIHEAIHDVNSPVKTALEEKVREIIKEELDMLVQKNKKKRKQWI